MVIFQSDSSLPVREMEMPVLKHGSLWCFEARRQCCVLCQAGEVSLQGYVMFCLLLLMFCGARAAQPATIQQQTVLVKMSEKPMLGREATATLPSYILIPLHVAGAFVTLQDKAAQTPPFTPGQCGRPICVSRQPFPLPYIVLVQDFVKLSQNILELAGMHSLWRLYK